MRVIHTVGGLHTSLGGPSRSVPGLCSALVERGVDTVLITVNLAGEGTSIAPSTGVDFMSVPGRRLRRLRQIQSPQFEQALRGAAAKRKPDVLHDHGLWLLTNHVAAQTALEQGVPLVIAPRGMLSPWALSQNKWMKRIAWHVYQRRNLSHAVVIHATSKLEAHDVRQLNLTSTVAIIPNGVRVEDFDWPIRNRQRSQRRIALFLSRMHKKKGLEVLIEAWAAVRPANWTLVAGGPGDQEYRRRISTLIQDKGVSDSVVLSGEADDADRKSLFSEASLFVLPTFSENFGIVVAEALAAGVPVITTKAAPWQELQEHRCGWWIDLGTEPLARALRIATKLPESELLSRGERGRRLVQARYSWSSVATQMEEVYEWISGSSSVPASLSHEYNPGL